MTLELDHIVSGIGARSGKIERETIVETASDSVGEDRASRYPSNWKAAQNRDGNGNGCRPADTDDADGATARCRRDRRDRVTASLLQAPPVPTDV